MKQFYIFIFFVCFLCIANAQKVQRHISFRTFDKDSIGLSLNDEYYLIEDSCAQIIRYTRFNFGTKKFYGKFRDISKANPELVVAEGNYTTDGLKDGLFISYYLNGKLQAKGNFKNNKYDGKWETYYNDGKPELKFEVVDGNFIVTDVWEADGKKTVDAGNGIYVSNVGRMHWKGKLVNGKPDGRWNLTRDDDINNMPISTELYRKGEFKEGSMGNIEFKFPHVVLVSPYKLPVVNAEQMRISEAPCNGAKRKHVVNAQYDGGMGYFTASIGDAVSPYMSKLNLTRVNTTIEIVGEVSEGGALSNLRNNGSDVENIARGLILQLRGLPPLHPATVDGKPVKQNFSITFIISDGWYRMNYRFLPIKAD